MYSNDVLHELAVRIGGAKAGDRPVIVGIDGTGGAGKSTLAAGLAGHFDSAAVVHLDDLYLSTHLRETTPSHIGGNYDRVRIAEQVLRPLRETGRARYQRYDWEHDALADWIDIADVNVVIVEGVTAIADDFAACYDVTIWVETPHAICLQRGVARDGESMRSQWEQVWLPGDERYRGAQRPHERADVVVSGIE